MRTPLAIDLYCGLGGWSEGLLAEGWNVVGFDIERHVYGEHRYPSQLVLQDVLTIHGRQFKDADLIVASPPCQEFSYMAMPWSKAKEKQRQYEAGERDVKQLTALFDACFRIQREASEAAGRHIPLVVENVRGAQKWVGRARWHFGSFYLWGDVPALMPQRIVGERKSKTGSWDPTRKNFAGSEKGWDIEGVKVGGISFSGYGEPNYKGVAFNGTAVKQLSPARRAKHYEQTAKASENDGIKQGGDWLNQSQPSISRRTGSKSPARKAASAMIAKIPEALSRHIARIYYPS